MRKPFQTLLDWRSWAVALLMAAPLGLVMAYGKWDLRDYQSWPAFFWWYTVIGGLAVAYFDIRYFGKK